MTDSVLLERNERIATITLNRPDTRNALSADVVEGLVDALNTCQADSSVSCIVLTGNGKSFSSGGNLHEIKALTAEQKMDPAALEEWYRNGIQRIPMTMNAIDVPVVAAVNGHAIGAGCDLAAMCDMRVASEDAVFAESFLRVGIIPGDGGAWFLPRVIGQARANEMLYTAEGIPAGKALSWGLVSEVVPHDALLDTAKAIAAKVVANPPLAIRRAKRIMRASADMSLADSLGMAATAQGILQQHDDHREAIDAILEKRKPSFQGR